MKTREFHYHLPQHLIAQKPCEVRSQSRLLHYSRASHNIKHLQFSDIADLIQPGDLLVFNNTRVIPARIYGHKETGGKVEVLIERLSSEFQCLAHVKASKTAKPGSKLILSNPDTEQQFTVSVDGREGDLFILSAEAGTTMAEMMESIGHMPLPPYISRQDSIDDFSR